MIKFRNFEFVLGIKGSKLARRDEEHRINGAQNRGTIIFNYFNVLHYRGLRLVIFS